uniref:Uncharacterized protein n=1 Tax=Laticauda laticaudata TaxID=8630 RepID=A0A8C5SSG3_LATLA
LIMMVYAISICSSDSSEFSEIQKFLIPVVTTLASGVGDSLGGLFTVGFILTSALLFFSTLLELAVAGIKAYMFVLLIILYL